MSAGVGSYVVFESSFAVVAIMQKEYGNQNYELYCTADVID
jgi:hypothetical protein